jgi:hypothetical protein
VSFLEKVDRICLDAANQYVVVSGHQARAEQRRSKIATNALDRFLALGVPTEVALDYNSLVTDKARIARLRAAVASAASGGHDTVRLRTKLRDAEAAASVDAEPLGLHVCGHLRDDFE